MLALMFPPSLGHIAASARADLLTRWFAQNLGVDVRIEVAATYQDLRRAIDERRIDLAWAPPVVCASVQDSCLTVLKAVRGGRSMYRSALVVRRGEAHSLTDLQGFHAAWVDRLSTAGYLLPVAHLRAQGHEPEELLARQAHHGSYGRALRAVVERDADLAAVYVRDATDEAAASSIAELVGESAHLHAVSFTAEAPSDGLVVLDRGTGPDLRTVVDRLESVGRESSSTMLLTIFDAEALEPAAAHDYDALLQAMT